MLTKTKLTIAALIIAGSASAASAQFDPNPASRYPQFAAPNAAAPYLGQTWGAAARSATRGAFQSAPVRLNEGGAPQQSFGYNGGQQDEIAVDLQDHASSPYAPGGGN